MKKSRWRGRRAWTTIRRNVQPNKNGDVTAGKRKAPGISRRSEAYSVIYGAEDWTRTSTPLRAQEPESCVSTNSTTSASELSSYHLHFYIASTKRRNSAKSPKYLTNRRTR